MSSVVPMDDDFNPNKRKATSQGFRSSAQQGAEEVGKGLEVTIPRSFPHVYNNNYTVRLTYADTFRHDIINSSAGGVTQVFRTNSIFDPDFTGTGHQPLGRDLWASMYDYYAVLSTSYTIRMYNCSGQDPIIYTAVGTNAQNLGSMNVMMLPTTNTLDYGALITISPTAEMKNVRTDMLTPGEKSTYKGTLTPGDFIVDAKDADIDTTWTANGSNPAVPRFFGYVLTPVNQVMPLGTVENAYSAIHVQVILEYTVQFTQINPTLRGVAS